MHTSAHLVTLHSKLDGMSEREEKETNCFSRASGSFSIARLPWIATRVRWNRKVVLFVRRGRYPGETIAIGECQAVGAVVGEGDAVVAPEE